MSHDALNAQTAINAPIDGEEIYQLVKRSDINPHEVEDAATQQIEVSVLWERSILHVAHLENGRSFVLASGASRAKSAMPAVVGGFGAGTTLIATSAATGNYLVGAIGTAMALAGVGAGIVMDQRNQSARREEGRFIVDAAMLGGANEVSVVRCENGTARFVFAHNADGEIEIAGVKHSLAQLVVDGRATAVPGSEGAFEIAIAADTKHRMTIGGLTIVARIVARGRKVAGARRRDPATVWAGLGAAGAVATIIGSALVATSGDGGLITADDREAQMQELQHIMALAHDREPAREEHHEAASQPSPGTGTAHAGPSGAMGARDSSQRNRRYAVRRTSDTPQLAQQSARDQVQRVGIFAALGAPGGPMTSGGQGPVSPFGGMMESGLDAESFNGNMTGDLAGEANGYGGLGPVGTGNGGGGDGQGTVGTGRFNTMGHGNGMDIGTGVARHLGPRDTHGPRIVSGVVQSPGMSPDAIRRVVVRNIGQVAHCHEQGLAQNPTLAGRVVVRFVIGSDGIVLGSSVAESSVSVPTVSTCIADAVRRWNFPVPEGGGAVTVTYPFNLQPPQ